MQWNGSTSQRFGGHRTHLKPEDSLAGGLRIAELPNFSNGIKCFEPRATPQQADKKYMRTYDHSYQLCDKEIDLRGRKAIDFKPTEEPPRREKLHIYVP